MSTDTSVARTFRYPRNEALGLLVSVDESRDFALREFRSAESSSSQYGEAVITGLGVTPGLDSPVSLITMTVFRSLTSVALTRFKSSLLINTAPMIVSYVTSLGSGESLLAIPADTDRALTLQSASRAWNAISRPTEIEEVDISFDPDDFPLL
jgi:hypothetical protein